MDDRQIREAVRSSAKCCAIDRYSAALFAPSTTRDDLITLAAFTGEIDHVVRSARDTALAEIRLQWWRDCLTSGAEGTRSGHPVVDAFANVVKRRGLPLAEVNHFIDARADDLVAGPPSDDSLFDGHLRAVDGIPLLLAARVLGAGVAVTCDKGFEAAIAACGRARVARELGFFLARGVSPVPPSRAPTDLASAEGWRHQIERLAFESDAALTVARAAFPHIRKDLRVPLLPLALIGPYFAALLNSDHDPTRDLVEIAPLARLWHLTRAHVVGHF